VAPTRVARHTLDGLPQGQARRCRWNPSPAQFGNASRRQRITAGTKSQRNRGPGTSRWHRPLSSEGTSERRQTRGWQNSQLCTAAAAACWRPKAEHIGGSRVTAVISDRDTALQMLESTSDLIESVCARTGLIARDIASRRLGSVYGRLATAAEAYALLRPSRRPTCGDSVIMLVASAQATHVLARVRASAHRSSERPIRESAVRRGPRRLPGRGKRPSGTGCTLAGPAGRDAVCCDLPRTHT
jgi:hypothetical protein